MPTDEATKAVMLLAATYPAARLDEPERARVWISMLEDIPPDALRAAVKRLIVSDDSPFGPTIARVRKAAVGAQGGLPDGSASEAWGTVLAEISRVGWCGAPKFDDPVTARAVQSISNWADLCATNISDMPAHRARFLQAYESIHRRLTDGALLPEHLRREIEDCKRAHLHGALDDAKAAELGEGDRRNSPALNILRDAAKAAGVKRPWEPDA